jgi:hypothetical protein
MIIGLLLAPEKKGRVVVFTEDEIEYVILSKHTIFFSSVMVFRLPVVLSLAAAGTGQVFRLGINQYDVE